MDSCPACPVEVRGLYASAHNAVLAVEAAQGEMGSWERAFRKMAELKSAVEAMQPIVDKHFEDRSHWNGPQSRHFGPSSTQPD